MWSIIADKGREVPADILVDISDYDVKLQQISYGDYAILKDNKIFAVIERKTWSDLAATIKDNRKHNHEKLLAFGKENNCRIIYLIEGKMPKEKINGIAIKNLRMYLTKRQYEFCMVEYSRDAADSAQRIIHLVDGFKKWTRPRRNINDLTCDDTTGDVNCMNNAVITDNNAKIDNKNNIFGGVAEGASNDDQGAVANNVSDAVADLSNVTNLVKSKIASFENIREDCIKKLNGVTKETYLVIKKYKVLDLLCNKIDETEIANLCYSSGRKFGKAVSKKICNQDRKSISNFYRAVPGISSVILRGLSAQFDNLIDIHKLSVDEIANIKVTERDRRIGNKIAQRILDVLMS